MSLIDNPTPYNVSLFVTCTVDQFYPEIGESTVRFMRRLGVQIDFPARQTFCGQIAFNSGFWDQAKPLASGSSEALTTNLHEP